MAVAALVLEVMWVEALVHVMGRREFGLPFLNYLVPVGALIFQLLAVLVWYNITNASFGNQCSRPSNEVFQKPPLCPTTGPSLAAASLAVLGTLVPVHCLLYALRDYVKPQKRA